ncbi:MAG: hypothetical protein HYV29_05020 [Ignavibacteriales bacterium]|nr:hypothetical protein [Ignavibacteriales bacterium]
MMKELHSETLIQCAVGIVAVSLMVLLVVPEKYIYVRPFTEDGFYSLTVARNIAEGKGITIDGTAMTNGFQPLFTLVCVIPFAVAGGDLSTVLQILYVIQVVMFFATSLIVALCVRDSISEQRGTKIVWLSILLYSSSLYIFLMHVNALETGFLILMYALIWRFIQTRFSGTVRSFVHLGILFGSLVLVRIDAGFFCALFAVVYVWSQRRGYLVRSIKGISISAVIALTISSPWWMYNVWYFGSPVPTSGLAQQKIMVSTERIVEAFRAVLQNIVPFIYAARYDNWYVDVVKLCAVIIIVTILYKKKELALDRDRLFHIVIISTVTLLAVWYSFTSYATFFYERYLVPSVLLSILYTVKFLLNVKQKGVSTAILIAVVLPLVGWQMRAYTGPSYGSLEEFYMDTNPKYRLIKTAVPEQDKIGSGQSGFLGFMRDHTINLDGKVNAEVLPFQDSMWAYLDANGIRWVCDTKEYVEQYLSDDPSSHGWLPVGESDGVMLYKRMQCPHR